MFLNASCSFASIERKLFRPQPDEEGNIPQRMFELRDWSISQQALDGRSTHIVLCDVAPGSGQSAGYLANQLQEALPGLAANQITVLALLAAPAAADHLLNGESPRVGKLITGYMGSGLESSGMIVTQSPKGGHRLALDDVERAVDLGWVRAEHARLDRQQALVRESSDGMLPLDPIH